MEPSDALNDPDHLTPGTAANAGWGNVSNPPPTEEQIKEAAREQRIEFYQRTILSGRV